MAKENEVKVPDIGGATDVEVIEILVKKGDSINKDTPLITLETDKASMEIPSPLAGVVKAIEVKAGSKVSEGDLILTVEASSKEAQVESPKESKPAELEPESTPHQNAESKEKPKKTEENTVKVPDIGGATNVDVIEILVKKGDNIHKDTPLITLESEKASMEIPSPLAGVVKTIEVNVGSKVSEGDVILIVESTEKAETTETKSEPKKSEEPKEEKPISIDDEESSPSILVSAGPAVRRMARQLGIDLANVQGTGRKSRIRKEDIEQYVRNKLAEKSSKDGLQISEAPKIDFSKFGPIEKQPLNKIKRLTGVNVHRAWVTVPHVTQFDEADITELEAFRKAELERSQEIGYKLTILAFVCKVVCKALVVFPQFNTSLDASGENLIYKQYVNIGIAVETPNGLVVPVIKDVDKLTVCDIAKEMGRLSAKAREKGLTPVDMSGGCFTISSLGGIGGIAFTPIVNSPEVAILGLSRSTMKPIYQNGEFVPRLMLPLSLSYDHRVIDGAEAARFTRYVSEALSDVRRILL